jgi:phosphoribosylaminoimidazole-succinocarboxamide synthase
LQQKLALLYEGKAKQVFVTDNPDLYIVVYKDVATAFDGLKKEIITGKGSCNAQISAILFDLLEREGVPTHFEQLLGEHEMLVKRLEIIPLEVVVRNIAAGSLANRLGLQEGTVLSAPVVEFYYKSDALHDPLINNDHIQVLGMASRTQVQNIKQTALKVNKVLQATFEAISILLVDFKLEFGIHKGDILLGDEISPDTCRFWDKVTREKLDKDRFRRDLGGVPEAYREVLARLSKTQPQ